MFARRPEDCDRLFAEGVNAGDVEAVVGLYEEAGCFVRRDGMAVGTEAVRTVIAKMVAGKPRLRCDLRRVLRAGVELALLYNDWKLVSAGADGQTTERTGKALELVRRQADGTWRYVIDDPYGRG
jgi:uncharacterized protein (TIGR02246 family)